MRFPESYKSAHLYSDFWSAYQLVLPSEQHQAVGKESGKTNHVERWNNTLRQRLAQFVRKTLSFSKCVNMHFVRLKLFIHRYNPRAGLCHLILSHYPKILIPGGQYLGGCSRRLDEMELLHRANLNNESYPIIFYFRPIVLA